MNCWLSNCWLLNCWLSNCWLWFWEFWGPPKAVIRRAELKINKQRTSKQRSVLSSSLTKRTSRNIPRSSSPHSHSLRSGNDYRYLFTRVAYLITSLFCMCVFYRYFILLLCARSFSSLGGRGWREVGALRIASFEIASFENASFENCFLWNCFL